MTRAALRSLGDLFDATRAESGRDAAVERLVRAVESGKHRAPRAVGVPAEIEAVISAIARHHGYALDDLRRHAFTRDRGSNKLASVRGEAVFLVRALSDVSYPTLGRYFGGRHHATLMSARAAFAARLKVDDVLRRRIDRILGEERAVMEMAADEAVAS